MKHCTLLICLLYCLMTSAFAHETVSSTLHKASSMWQKDSAVAIDCYTQALSMTKDENETAEILLERGNCFFYMKNYEAAIQDYSRCIAIVCPIPLHEVDVKSLALEDRRLIANALFQRFYCHGVLFHEKELKYDEEMLEIIDPDYPLITQEGNLTIMKTGKKDGSLLEQMRDVYMQAHLIEKPEDIQMSANGTITIFNKMLDDCKSCCDSCKEGHECEDKKMQERGKGSSKKKPAPQPAPSHNPNKARIEVMPNGDMKIHKTPDQIQCQKRCDRVASAAFLFIDGHILRKVAAIGLICTLKHYCRKCCMGNGFYENCIQPLESWLQCPYDPAFNDVYDDTFNRPNPVNPGWVGPR